MSVLDKLREGRIVHFHLAANKSKVEVSECCDDYFIVDLTKGEILLLAQELTRMAEGMVE